MGKSKSFFYDKAQKLATEAKELELSGKLEDAYVKCESAAAIIVTTAKNDRRKEIRELYLHHAATYIDRAEVIKDAIKNQLPVNGSGRTVATSNKDSTESVARVEEIKPNVEFNNSYSVDEKPIEIRTDDAGLKSEEKVTRPKLFTTKLSINNLNRVWQGTSTRITLMLKLLSVEEVNLWFTTRVIYVISVRCASPVDDPRTWTIRKRFSELWAVKDERPSLRFPPKGFFLPHRPLNFSLNGKKSSRSG
jgi:hypothetical protein